MFGDIPLELDDDPCPHCPLDKGNMPDRKIYEAVECPDKEDCVVGTEAFLKMAENIESLFKMIEGLEKTIEVHGELIDRLEKKLYEGGKQ